VRTNGEVVDDGRQPVPHSPPLFNPFRLLRRSTQRSPA
jgi:hypothetical protein